MDLTVVIVPDEASGIQGMDTRIHLIIVPVEARVLILVPLSVEPDRIGTVVLDELLELSVHEGIVGLPLAVRRTSRTTSRTPDRIVVITRPVQERIVDMEA